MPSSLVETFLAHADAGEHETIERRARSSEKEE